MPNLIDGRSNENCASYPHRERKSDMTIRHGQVGRYAVNGGGDNGPEDCDQQAYGEGQDGEDEGDQRHAYWDRIPTNWAVSRDRSHKRLDYTFGKP